MKIENMNDVLDALSFNGISRQKISEMTDVEIREDVLKILLSNYLRSEDAYDISLSITTLFALIPVE